MKRKKEKHEKKIDKALHLAEERLELLDTIKEMVETEVDKQMKKVYRRVGGGSRRRDNRRRRKNRFRCNTCKNRRRKNKGNQNCKNDYWSDLN